MNAIMSLTSLALDSLHLSRSSSNLSLSLTSTIHLKSPSTTLHALSDIDAIKDLVSGSFWVTRGAECCIDIYLTLDGQQLTGPCRDYTMEVVASFFHDTPLWSQLSLLASTVASQGSGIGQPDMKISLSHMLPARTKDAKLGGLLKSDVDFRAPGGVFCADFNRLELRFDIQHTQRIKPPFKKAKTCSSGMNLPKVEAETTTTINTNLNKVPVVDDAVRSEQNFKENMLLRMGDLDVDKRHLQNEIHESEMLLSATSYENSESDSKGVEALRYTPSNFEYWKYFREIPEYDALRNAPEVMPSKRPQSASLNKFAFPSDFRTSLGSCSGDDELLLNEFEDVDTPLSSLSSSAPPSLKRPSSDDDALDLIQTMNDCQSLGLLVENATRIIVGGYGLGSKGMSGTLVKKPRPRVSLCQIAPSLWSPGFRESMNHNAQFVSSISRSMSLSWAKNAQSPNLRRKIAKLKNTPPSTSSITTDRFDEEAATGGELGTIIQARLWAMMQHKLYDPLAARRMPGRSIDNSAWPSQDDMIMATMQNQSNDEFEPLPNTQSYPVKDIMVEDLLADDDFEMFSDVNDVETRTTEQETEEMLLFDSDLGRGLPSDLLFAHQTEKPYIHCYDLALALDEFNDMLLDQDAYFSTQKSHQRRNSSVCFPKESNDGPIPLLLEAGFQEKPDELLLGSDCSDIYEDLGRTLPRKLLRPSEDYEIMLNHSAESMALANTSRPQIQDFHMPSSGTLEDVGSPSIIFWDTHNGVSRERLEATNRDVESKQENVRGNSEESFATQDSDMLL